MCKTLAWKHFPFIESNHGNYCELLFPSNNETRNIICNYSLWICTKKWVDEHVMSNNVILLVHFLARLAVRVRPCWWSAWQYTRTSIRVNIYYAPWTKSAYYLSFFCINFYPPYQSEGIEEKYSIWSHHLSITDSLYNSYGRMSFRISQHMYVYPCMIYSLWFVMTNMYIIIPCPSQRLSHYSWKESNYASYLIVVW